MLPPLSPRPLHVVAAMFIALAGCDQIQEAQRPAGDVPPSPAPSASATKTFTNSREIAAAPALQENYIDFAFDYPGSWTLDPETGTPVANNFVKVLRPRASEVDTESFAVGYLNATGVPAADAELIPQVLGQLEAQFAAGFPGFELVSRGETSVGGRPGREFRFQSSIPAETAGEPLTLWGRVIAIPPPEGRTVGAAMVLLATNKAPEIKGAADLGEKGGAPVILRSFRFGGGGSAAAPPPEQGQAEDQRQP